MGLGIPDSLSSSDLASDDRCMAQIILTPVYGRPEQSRREGNLTTFSKMPVGSREAMLVPGAKLRVGGEVPFFSEPLHQAK